MRGVARIVSMHVIQYVIRKGGRQLHVVGKGNIVRFLRSESCINWSPCLPLLQQTGCRLSTIALLMKPRRIHGCSPVSRYSSDTASGRASRRCEEGIFWSSNTSFSRSLHTRKTGEESAGNRAVISSLMYDELFCTMGASHSLCLAMESGCVLRASSFVSDELR